MTAEPFAAQCDKCWKTIHNLFATYGDHVTGLLCYECWVPVAKARERMAQAVDPYYKPCKDGR